MILDTTSSKRFMPFISLVILYILLIGMVLILSQQILLGVSEGQDLTSSPLFLVMILLPLVLVGSLIFQGWRLYQDWKKKSPGIRLKFRLTIFFILTAMLSAIPQGILSINFIDTTMNSWFGASLGEALDGGLKIALDFHHDKTNNLREFAENPLIPALLRPELLSNPNLFWKRVKEINGSLDSVQVYQDRKTPLVEAGDPQGFIRNPQILRRSDGVLPKESTQENSILRTMKTYEIGATVYSVISSIVLPPGFDNSAKELTRALETYKQLLQFNNTFRSIVLLFYLVFAFPIFLISLLISFTLSNDLIRPLVHLENATKRVAEGDYSFRILSRPQDELSALVNSFNTMIGELEGSRTKIQQTEKISTWQEIAQQLAHEIRNPLTPIKLSAERILRKHQTDPEALPRVIEPAVEAIIHEVTKLDNLLREFSDFARLPLPVKEWTPLLPILEEVAGVHTASEPQVSLDISEVNPQIQLFADKKQLGQVFTNLFKNAIEAMERQGTIRVLASLIKKGNSSYCRIQVQDNGPGIAPEDYEKVFNPYYTTKSSGTGLGLSIVERIVFDHKGSIWFESQVGYGTTFFIDLFMEKAQ